MIVALGHHTADRAGEHSVFAHCAQCAAAALDTLNELATALGNDANFAASIAAELTNRVRVDQAQVFTEPQKTQGRSNIGAAAVADLTALTTAIGNTDYDFVADYTTAKT